MKLGWKQIKSAIADDRSRYADVYRRTYLNTLACNGFTRDMTSQEFQEFAEYIGLTDEEKSRMGRR